MSDHDPTPNSQGPTPKAPEPTALIVGAGIGGLAAALGLQRAGWRVTVFERAASPGELGFALLLAPNAMYALDALGLADVARTRGAIATEGEMRRPNGTVLRRFSTAAAREVLGENAVCILRPVLHGALLDAVGIEHIVLGSPVVRFEDSADAVRVTLANGGSATGDVLIGADGVGSLVRRQLHPAEDPPRSSGLLAIRGVARDVVHHLGNTSGAQYFGRGLEAGLARAGEREVYWYMSLRIDELPVATRDPLVLANRCAAQFHEPFRAIVRSTPVEDLRLDELFQRDPIEAWGRGRVTLLGDAAHPMLPHAGQGAAQALEDAVALARVLEHGSGIEEGLRRYERVRASRTRAIVRIARRNARAGSISNVLGCWMRDQLIAHIPQSVILKSLVAFGRPPEP